MGIDSCGILLSAIPKKEGEEKRNLIMFDRRIRREQSCTNAVDRR